MGTCQSMKDVDAAEAVALNENDNGVYWYSFHTLVPSCRIGNPKTSGKSPVVFYNRVLNVPLVALVCLVGLIGCKWIYDLFFRTQTSVTSAAF